MSNNSDSVMLAARRAFYSGPLTHKTALLNHERHGPCAVGRVLIALGASPRRLLGVATLWDACFDPAYELLGYSENIDLADGQKVLKPANWDTMADSVMDGWGSWESFAEFVKERLNDD
jgi:hypothetical protein